MASHPASDPPAEVLYPRLGVDDHHLLFADREVVEELLG